MRLLISNENFLKKEMDVCHLRPKEFANHAFLPYILTNDWDKCIIELSDDIPSGYISQALKGIKVTAFIPEGYDITSRDVGILREIYPEYRAKLSLYYRRSIDDFNKLLREVSYNG